MPDTDTMQRETPSVRPDVQAFLDAMNANPGPPMSAIPLEEARAGYLALQDRAEQPPRELALIRDLACPGPAGEIRLRLYDRRETRGPSPVVLFFHGGGFVIGDLDSHHSLCTEIAAELDVPVVSVDYRRAPESPFPAAPDDCEAAARWIAASPDALGRSVTGLVPMGDSAGGNLAIVTTQALTNRPAAAPVVLQVPIYPLTDEGRHHPSAAAFADGYFLSSEGSAWFGKCYGARRGEPRAFPIYGSHANTPPTVLVTAELDPIRDGGRLYAAELARAGRDVVFLEMKGTIHGFAQFRKALPSARGDLASVLAAARVILDRSRSQDPAA